LGVKLREQSKIVARYIDAAEPQYSAVLIEEDWLDRAQVGIVRMNTNLATMRVTVWWVSRGRQTQQDIKRHCQQFLELRYKLVNFDFRQSKQEVDASTPLSTYFHCIASVRDSVSGR